MPRSLVIDNIGSLVTNDPTLGRGPLGILEDACVVIVDGAVAHVGAAGEIADERIDADGACVLPGFVDSHTHLVFAGDRAEEFTARMAGEPYDGGGIRTTTEATRDASTDELDRLVRRRLVEARQAGTTTIEIKSGYGLNVGDEARSVEIARRHTAESTFLGAHLAADRVRRPPRRLHRSRVHRHARRRARRTPRGSTRSARPERSTPTSAEPCWRRAAPPASDCGCTATNSATARVCNSRSSAGARRSTTARTSPTPTSRRWPASDTVATFLPATDFSTRQPYPDARRVIDAGATVAIASNCNPGSSYTTSISFCIALAVRDMHMTIDEAIAAVTVGGAAALPPQRCRPAHAGRRRPRGHPRRTDAPSPRLPTRRPPHPPDDRPARRVSRLTCARRSSTTKCEPIRRSQY